MPASHHESTGEVYVGATGVVRVRKGFQMIRPGMTGSTRRSSAWIGLEDAGDVHVWSDPADETGDIGGGHTLLDDAERARADRFRFDRDRARFVLRHAFVRRVLGRYLSVEPAAVAIRVSASGKPELRSPCGISFSLSHADDMTVVAVTRGRCVGVDVERLRHIDDAIGVAEGLFAKPEVELLRSVPPASRSQVFLTLWTRKESFVKALGGGLSIPLDGFVVLAQGDTVVGRPRGPLGALPFIFAQLLKPHGYIGSVTVAGTRVAVHHMDPGMVA